jgi:hypothetical protein
MSMMSCELVRAISATIDQNRMCDMSTLWLVKARGRARTRMAIATWMTSTAVAIMVAASDTVLPVFPTFAAQRVDRYGFVPGKTV